MKRENETKRNLNIIDSQHVRNQPMPSLQKELSKSDLAFKTTKRLTTSYHLRKTTKLRTLVQ